MKSNTLFNKKRRKIRVRNKIKGTDKRPRLSVFRSNRYIFAQLIDDNTGKTLVALSERKLPQKELVNHKRVEKARLVGKYLATKALKKKITHVVFDRNGYKYHGRVKALADGAREGGLRI